ncbi:MAG: 16S rRNA (guanine(527)-N(7))-methyltransferase RsmG [Pseudomonadota bacterium]
MKPEDLRESVSRETLTLLERYVAEIRKWNPAINLISPNSLDDIWHRHIADSLQVSENIPVSVKIVADFGSGGGLPGLVTAIVAKERYPKIHSILVESDARKSAFLSTVISKLELNAAVKTSRIETLDCLGVDLITARALAPLSDLCHYTSLHLSNGGTALFLKGRSYESEVDEARKHWQFDLTVIPSKTDSQAAILSLKNLESSTRQ